MEKPFKLQPIPQPFQIKKFPNLTKELTLWAQNLGPIRTPERKFRPIEMENKLKPQRPNGPPNLLIPPFRFRNLQIPLKPNGLIRLI